MKKTKRSWKYTSLAFLLFIIISSCSSNYLDVKQINLNEYYPVAKELSGKSQIVDSLFVALNPTTNTRTIELKDFHFNNILINSFPKCYKLLSEKKAVEIDYFSHTCIFIILRKHDGVFLDRFECLKIGSLNSCDLSLKSETSVEKEVKLANGLCYQIIVQYIDS